MISYAPVTQDARHMVEHLIGAMKKLEYIFDGGGAIFILGVKIEASFPSLSVGSETSVDT